MGKGAGEMRDKTMKTMKSADRILSSVRSRLSGAKKPADGGKEPAGATEAEGVVPINPSEILSERDVMGRELRNMAEELKAG